MHRVCRTVGSQKSGRGYIEAARGARAARRQRGCVLGRARGDARDGGRRLLRALGGEGDAGDVGRAASVGGNGSKGTGGLIQPMEVGTMVVIWRAGRRRNAHGKAVADDDRPRRNFASAGVRLAWHARRPQCNTAGSAREHDKDGERLECVVPELPSTVNPSGESRGLVRSFPYSFKPAQAPAVRRVSSLRCGPRRPDFPGPVRQAIPFRALHGIRSRCCAEGCANARVARGSRRRPDAPSPPAAAPTRSRTRPRTRNRHRRTIRRASAQCADTAPPTPQP